MPEDRTRDDFALHERQLPRLCERLGDSFTLVPVIIGQLEPDQACRAAAALLALLREGTVVIAATNWSSWGVPLRYTRVTRERSTLLEDCGLGTGLPAAQLRSDLKK